MLMSACLEQSAEKGNQKDTHHHIPLLSFLCLIIIDTSAFPILTTIYGFHVRTRRVCLVRLQTDGQGGRGGIKSRIFTLIAASNTHTLISFHQYRFQKNYSPQKKTYWE
ncbi:hypothetical protein BC567DRAFT_16774 [Phyllosticta citribraziliensis]